MGSPKFNFVSSILEMLEALKISIHHLIKFGVFQSNYWAILYWPFITILLVLFHVLNLVRACLDLRCPILWTFH